MIIGNGLIASLFKNKDKEDIIFFASGVSNSLETRKEEFLREEKLILEAINKNPDSFFVYFSTCSIYDSSKNGSQYVNHKLKMERIIENSCPKYLLLRVSNAVGKGGNPNLLMNYIIRSVKNNEQITVQTLATRNLIDAEDIKKITFRLIENNLCNKIINIAYPQNYSIIEIMEIVERFYDIKLDINLVKAGQNYAISIPEVEDYFKENNLTDKDAYLCNLLKNYYS